VWASLARCENAQRLPCHATGPMQAGGGSAGCCCGVGANGDVGVESCKALHDAYRPGSGAPADVGCPTMTFSLTGKSSGDWGSTSPQPPRTVSDHEPRQISEKKKRNIQ
jgi:hypothetical protein